VPLPPHIGLGGLYRLHLFRNRSARHLDLTFQAYEQGTPPASGTGNGEAGLTAKPRARRQEVGGATGRGRKSFRPSFRSRSKAQRRASSGPSF
jgi:hypothetical protein